MKQSPVFQKIAETIQSLKTVSISEERKSLLQPLIDYIQQKLAANQEIRLNFICTHNSRRSHLSQIWAQTFSQYYRIPKVFCYSGGTEATAMFPKVAETLISQGFQISKIALGNNPVYAVRLNENSHPIICFSKTYDAIFNPTSTFGAIMTCDSANEACPMVIGAEQRFPITYTDPKAFDNTPLQTEKYLEKSLEIATELAYVFGELKR